MRKAILVAACAVVFFICRRRISFLCGPREDELWPTEVPSENDSDWDLVRGEGDLFDKAAEKLELETEEEKDER